MNGKERVKRAVEFNKPDRVPACGPYTGDCVLIFPTPSSEWHPSDGSYPHVHGAIEISKSWRWKKPSGIPRDWKKHNREEVDEWGCYWDRRANDPTMGSPGRPIFETWDDFEDWDPPDYSDPRRFKFFGRLSKFLGTRYSLDFVEEGLGLFDRASMLRGFSNFMSDLRRYPNKVTELLQRINETYLQGLEISIKYKPDAVMALDDLGTQDSTFVSPSLFKKLFERFYREQIDFAHDHDLHYVLHSCGAVGEYIPLFLDWGVDVLEFDSPHLVGFPTIEKYKDKISFWGCVDIQTIYPKGTPEMVEEEVKTMIRRMGTSEGGFVAYFYMDPDVLNVPKENRKAFKRAVKKWGKYPLDWIGN